MTEKEERDLNGDILNKFLTAKKRHDSINNKLRSFHRELDEFNNALKGILSGQTKYMALKQEKHGKIVLKFPGIDTRGSTYLSPRSIVTTSWPEMEEIIDMINEFNSASESYDSLCTKMRELGIPLTKNR